MPIVACPDVGRYEIPEGTRLPAGVTFAWLAAVIAAGWHCRCQWPGDLGVCKHKRPCNHSGAGEGGYPLILTEGGRVVCDSCAHQRELAAQRAERAADPRPEMDGQIDLFGLVSGGESA